MYLVEQRMGVIKDNRKEELSEIYSQLIFFERVKVWSMECGDAWDFFKWTTHKGVAFLTMWDKEHMLKNIGYAMIQELMGKGPTYDCIINSAQPNFESKVLLLANYLPPEKICIHLPRDNFERYLATDHWKDLS